MENEQSLSLDQNLGCMAKIGFFGQKPILWAQQILILTMFWSRLEKLFKEKSCLFQNKYQSLKKFWVFFCDKTLF